MKASFFTCNRAELRRACGTGVIILTAYDALQFSADMAAPFRQESNFWYLTGVEEPGWLLVMTETDEYLVQPERSESDVLFDGASDETQIVATSGVKTLISRDDFKQRLAALSQQPVWTLLDAPFAAYVSFSLNPAEQRLRKQLAASGCKLNDCRPLLSRLRAVKQPEEIAALRTAIDVTVDAFLDAHRTLQHLTTEYEVEAEFHHQFRRAGAEHAYAPIVATGKNACTLHYTAAMSSLNNGDLVLMDIGAYAGGYAADITRTYGYGNVSDRAAQVHEAVRSAQHDIIGLVRPGLAVRDYHHAVDERMKQALAGLKLPTDDVSYRRYFPHAISHGLGIDVHDSLGQPEAFSPGMVLTVEPGIYILEEAIGVRIEDDILVTEAGNENLSARLPTELCYTGKQ